MTGMDYVVHLIHTEYVKLDEAGATSISPSQLADAVYDSLDPEKVSPELVQFIAVLELRQLARAECGKQHHDAELDIEQQQSDLFEYRLQKRYPTPRNGEDVYTLLDDLSSDELEANELRLRHEADAKKRHADALRNFRIKKFGFGPGDETGAGAVV